MFSNENPTFGHLTDIMTHYEAENIIEHLKIFDIREYGSDR
jgi:hypothetical protein